MSLSDRFRARALSHDPAELADSTNDDLLEDARRLFLEGVRRFDPRASFEISLDLHLTGQSIRPGALTFDAASAIFHHVQAEVREAVPPSEDKAGAELEVVGLSEGSAIVHARPATLQESPEGQLEFPLSVLDSAVQRILNLHDALESDDDLAAFSSTAALLDRLRKLTHDLDRHDVNLELRWRSSSGRTQRSVLSEHGRSRARHIFEKQETDQTVHLHGSIYSASLDGDLTLRVRQDGAIRSIRVKGVDSELISSDQMSLGRFVRIEATRERRADSVGLQESLAYQFDRLLSVDETLPETPEE